MIRLALLLLAASGLAWIVGGSAISFPIRTWMARVPALQPLVWLIECCGCFGFWTGLAWGLAHPGQPIPAIACGLAVSMSNLLLHRAAFGPTFNDPDYGAHRAHAAPNE